MSIRLCLATHASRISDRGFNRDGFFPADDDAMVEVPTHANDHTFRTSLPRTLRGSFFVEREIAETDEQLKQIVACVCVTYNRCVLGFQRRTDHTDARLASKHALLFGGHVEPDDLVLHAVNGERDYLGTVRKAAMRELREELFPHAHILSSRLRLLGVVNTAQDAVSRVHIGVVFGFSIDDKLAQSVYETNDRDAEIANVSWVSTRPKFEMEAWGEIFADWFFSGKTV